MLLSLLLACAPTPYERTRARCADGTEACNAALAEDLGITPEAFQPGDLERLLDGQRELLTWNLGPWPPAGPVHTPFREALEWVPGADTRERVYNFVAEQVEESHPVEGTEFAFRYRDGVLEVRSGYYNYDYASSLFHEASHAIAPPHTSCPDEPSCDTSWAGAYGMQVDVLELAVLHQEESLLQDTLTWADSRVEIE